MLEQFIIGLLLNSVTFLEIFPEAPALFIGTYIELFRVVLTMLGSVKLVKFAKFVLLGEVPDFEAYIVPPS